MDRWKGGMDRWTGGQLHRRGAEAVDVASTWLKCKAQRQVELLEGLLRILFPLPAPSSYLLPSALPLLSGSIPECCRPQPALRQVIRFTLLIL